MQSVKVRLYPSKKQEFALERHLNAYRFLYNLCLEYKIHLYKYHKINISGYELQSELYPLIKSIEWMKGLKVECLRQAALDVENSYENFFRGKGFPKFKSKKDKQSFIAKQSISIKNNKLFFFKNLIKFKTSEEFTDLLKFNTIKQCIFKKEKDNTWFACCIIDSKIINIAQNSTNVIGIDLGLTNFITTSDGEVIKNPSFYKNSERKYRKLQRKHSKSKFSGQNREKLRVKLAKLSRKIVNQKYHFFHQIANKLIYENQEIKIEQLKVLNLIKNRSLSKAISNVSWPSFIRILEYKCNKYNRKLTKVDTFYPSSKLCSQCGNKKDKLDLSERIYKCENCSLEIDRDLNAAINLANYSPTVKNTGSNASGDLCKTLEIKLKSKKEEFKNDYITI